MATLCGSPRVSFVPCSHPRLQSPCGMSIPRICTFHDDDEELDSISIGSMVLVYQWCWHSINECNRSGISAGTFVLTQMPINDNDRRHLSCLAQPTAAGASNASSALTEAEIDAAFECVIEDTCENEAARAAMRSLDNQRKWRLVQAHGLDEKSSHSVPAYYIDLMKQNQFTANIAAQLSLSLRCRVCSSQVQLQPQPQPYSFNLLSSSRSFHGLQSLFNPVEYPSSSINTARLSCLDRTILLQSIFHTVIES